MTNLPQVARRALATSLAALMAAPFASGQTDAESLRRLQEENAALRKQLAEFQARNAQATPTSTPPAAAPIPVVTPRATTSAATASASDDGVQRLSAFEVRTDKDYGYLKTNSVTATRVGMEIQRLPLTVSILSSDFIADTNMQQITDLLRYTSSGTGDNSFAMARPANSATPQGNFTIRAFQINTMLRNGVVRYTSFNLDNTERVEIVKGPAALFYGQGAPGGVINYITKEPVFGKIPTTLSYTTGDDQKSKVVVDTNQEFSKQVAMRIVGSWDNSKGQRRWEFTKNNNITGALAVVPFDSGILKFTLRGEWLDQQYNQNRQDWFYPDSWFQAYSNPTPGLIAAAGLTNNADPVTAYRNRIVNPGGYGTWGNDMRIAAGDFTLPTYTKIRKGAYYQNANNQRIHDEAFNYTERGALTKDIVNTIDATVEFSPFSWVDARYLVTNDNSRFDAIEGTINPYADGRRFNTLVASTAGYYRKATEHQFDLVLKRDQWGVKNKLLIGGMFRKVLQQYNANSSGTNFPYYANIPGASNPAGNPGGTYNNANPLAATLYNGGSFAPSVQTGNVPVNQVIRDRFGNIKTVQQVYTEWDPGTEIQPDVRPLAIIDRTLLDGYYSQDQAGYINWQGQALDDRLTVLAGVRREMHRDSGQYLTSNYPWFAPPNYAFTNQTAYDPTAYNYSPSYAGDRDGNFSRIAGTAWMAGVSYSLKKDLTVYATTSKIYNRNGATNAGGFSILDVPNWYNAAKAYLGNQPFVYRGKTINSSADLFSALHDAGADVLIKPETGRNIEVGVKTSLWDNRLVGTLSLFHMFRVNRRIDDATAQNNEPLNFANNAQYFGPPGTINAGFNFSNGRLLRWRTVGQKDVSEGADFELIWTPKRNFQSVINGAWTWKAKTEDAPTVAKPGSAAYNASTPQAKVASDIYYGSRLENAPEYRFNTFSKYTFTESAARGLSIGLGTRYASKIVVSRSVDWNPLHGGFQAGNYFVFDSVISYPWEIRGFRAATSLTVQNLFDDLYFESSSLAASPGRQIFITNTLRF